MTKQDIIKAAANKAGCTQDTAAAIINAALEAAADALIAGDNISVNNFGKLEQRQRKERAMKDFNTGEQVIIPASVTAAFVPAQALKDRLNGHNHMSKQQNIEGANRCE